VLTLVLRRLLWAVPMLFVVSALSFVLVSLLPGDPARSVLGPLATDQQVARARAQLGLDRSLADQYRSWLVHALHGDLGVSLQTGIDVRQLLDSRLAPTLSLIALSTLTAAVLGVALGVWSATRGGLLGAIIDVLSVIGLAVPAFWLALLLVSTFSIHWRLFPPTGYQSITASPAEWLRSLTLPVLTASLIGLTSVAKQTRDSVLDVYNRNFVLVMQANGLSRRSIVYRHVLRNAAIPVLSLLGVICSSLLGAAVLIENIFGLPGLGSGAAAAAAQHDIPVLQGAVVYFTIIVIVIGLLVDVGRAWLDPKVRQFS
jgi:peptide/nickel transport system permease protein